MKKINLQLILTSIRSRADGSMGLSMTTPELDTSEKVSLMELHNMVLKASLEPLDVSVSAEVDIDKEVGEKSPSQRLRAVLYVYQQQSNNSEDFNVFYRRHMEAIINNYKDKLE